MKLSHTTKPGSVQAPARRHRSERRTGPAAVDTGGNRPSKSLPRAWAALIPFAATLLTACGSIGSTVPSASAPSTRQPPGGGDTKPVVTPATSTAINSLTLGPGALFAATSTFPATNSKILRINPQTGKVSLLIRIKGQAQALTYGAGSLWVATDRALYRISPADPRVIAAISVPATALAYGAGAIWAANIRTDALTRVNTTTNRPSATLRMTEPTSVAAGEGSVWVGTDISPVVYRVNPTTVRVVAKVKVCGGRGGPQLAIASGAIWAANAACGTVSQIDPRSDSVRATITACRALRVQCGGPFELLLSAGGGYIWVYYEGVPNIRFARIDPSTRHVTPGPKVNAAIGPLQATTGTLWIVLRNGSVAKYLL